METNIKRHFYGCLEEHATAVLPSIDLAFVRCMYECLNHNLVVSILVKTLYHCWEKTKVAGSVKRTVAFQLHS